VSFQSCTPAVFPLPQGQAPFATDGSVFSPRTGSYRYLLGDSAGTVYQYEFDQSNPTGRLRWRVPLGGSVSGPLLAMRNPDSNRMTTLAPLRQPTALADPSAPNCGGIGKCVALLDDNSLRCYMATTADVITRPVASSIFPNTVYIGDQAGRILVYDSSTGGDLACHLLDLSPESQSGSMLAGPVVIPGNSLDHIYLVTFRGGVSRLLHYTAQRISKSFRLNLVWPIVELPGAWGKATGLALQAKTAPTRLAISFASGWLALVQINGTFGTSLADKDKKNMGTPLTAPYWWKDLFGVGDQKNGAFFVHDSNFAPVGTYSPLRPIPIIGSPTADEGGDWFFGAADGLLHELLPAPALTLAARWGYRTPAAGEQSSPVYDVCPAGRCIYMAKLDGTAYLVPLVDREVIMTACISITPPTCSGAKPELWARVTVASRTIPNSSTSPQTVRMLGFSYSSR
jgi:outer membrane protein assembly factor BamB